MDSNHGSPDDVTGEMARDKLHCGGQVPSGPTALVGSIIWGTGDGETDRTETETSALRLLTCELASLSSTPNSSGQSLWGGGKMVALGIKISS